MKRALALYLTAIAFLYAASANAEYLGEYDVGDTVTLHCVLNDNGTAADSVSGDSIKAIIYWQGLRVDTIGLDPAGASMPTYAGFYAKIPVDTTMGPTNQGGYGTWWALLWAVNVGAGTRDPVGEVSWSVQPRAATSTGAITVVTGNVEGNILGDLSGNVSGDVDGSVSLYDSEISAIADSVRVRGIALVDSVVGVANVQHTVLADSVTGSGNVQHVVLSDSFTYGGTIVFCDSTSDVGHVAIADSIGTIDSTFFYGLSYKSADTLLKTNIWGASYSNSELRGNIQDLMRYRRPGHYLGEYQQGDSITVGTNMTASGLDSAYAYIYWRTTATDTIKLTSTAMGYYTRIMADTTGAGWGDWHSVIKSFISTYHNEYAYNTWSLVNHHLYAQEVGESCDVYVHDPDDSTLALVIRDSLNAWADSFKADTVVAVTNDTFHLDTDDWGGLAGRIADSNWTGGENTRTLTASAYAEIADSVGVNIAALDTIAYVANVGTVALTDSAGKVGTVTRTILSDSTIASQRVRGVVLPIDSVVATARNWLTDSSRVVATALVADSARIVASCDSVGKVDTVRAVALSYALAEDSIGKVGWVGRADSVTASRRNWFTDSTRAANRVEVTERADSTVGVGRMVNPLDSVVAVSRAWDVDSLRVARRALAVTLADSVTGVRRLNGRVDSVTGVYRVAVLDSGTKVSTVDSTGILEYADTIRAVFRTRLNDSTVAGGRLARADSVVSVRLVWDADSVRSTGSIASIDSIRKVAVVDSAGKVRYADTLRAGGRVEAVTLTDSMAAGYRVRFVDDVDSSRVSARVWDADSLRVAWHTILNDSTTGAARVKIVDSTASQAVISSVDSVRAVGIVWDVDSTRALDHGRLVSEVTLTDSAIAVDRVLLTSTASVVTVVDSVRVSGGVMGLTTTTIANAVAAKTVGGAAGTLGRVLAEIDTVTTSALDSLQITEISTLAHTGDAMTLSPNERGDVRDSVFYTELDTSYHHPSVGRILWDIQRDSLATIAQIAGAGADSTRALIEASALQDSVDSLAARMGRTGDSTLADLVEYIADNLQAVQFPTSAISELSDSIWGAKLDSAGALKGEWDSSTAAAHLWDASPKHHGQDYQAIDSSTVDTSNVRLGVFHVGGSPVSGTEIYVYTLADSGWSQPIGEDLEPNADGRWWVPVYVPANGDTVYYRVRFHAPGYIDQTKIVRFPQP